MENTDRVTLMGLVFYAYHGVYPQEAELGQRFEVDVDLYFDTSQAGASDVLGDTVNYGQVYKTVEAVVCAERYHLLEALAAAIARAVLQSQPFLHAVTVRVRKPQAPIKGVFENVEIEITRQRSWLTEDKK